MKGSREFLEYVQTLEKFVTQLNESVASSQPAVMEPDLDALNDQMVDLAIAAMSTKGPYSVPRDHQVASSVFVEFATALMKENGMDSASSKSDSSLLEKFTFAAAQYDNPVTRNTNEMRRRWAEVKNPQMRIDRELAASKAAEKRKADEKAAIMASLDAKRKASEERSRQRSEDANEGRNSRMPSGLQDTIRNRSGGRGSGGPRFGKSGPPSSSKGFSGAVILKIEGSEETEELVKALAAKLKAKNYSHSHHRTTTTVFLQWTGTMQEIADQVDFGEVIEVNESRRQLKIQM